MKRAKIISVVSILVFLFGFYGIVLGGGAEDPACNFLPDPKHGPFVKGEFTVALDKSGCSIGFPSECAHYNVHLKLKHGHQTHLISFSTSIENRNICSYSASEIKGLFERKPCTLGIGTIFGYQGIPVIAEISITNVDFCSGGETLPGFPNVPLDAMIEGEIVIRVVPAP